MGSILVPGYLRWDGFKYVLDPTVEIVGPPGPPGPSTPGPPGPPGAAGPSGNAVLVYQPLGVASPNVYTSWTALMAARATTPSVPMTIVIDDRFTPGGAVIDTGTWNLNFNTAIVSHLLGGAQSTIVIPSGGTLQNPSYFQSLVITAVSMESANISTTGSVDLNIVDCLVSSAGQLNITLSGTVNLYGSTDFLSGSRSWLDGSGGIQFNLYDQSVIDNNTLAYTTQSVTIRIVSTGAFYNSTQPGMTVTPTLIGVSAQGLGGSGANTVGNVLTINSVHGTADWETPAGGGITQLTQDVLAGPGSGSQSALVRGISGNYGSNQYGGLPGAMTIVAATETVLAYAQPYHTDAISSGFQATGTGSFQTLLFAPTVTVGSVDASISLLGVDNASPTGVFRCDLTYTAIGTGSSLSAILQPSSPANPLNVRQQGTLSTVTAQVSNSGNTVTILVQVPNSVVVNWSIIGQFQWRQ